MKDFKHIKAEVTSGTLLLNKSDTLKLNIYPFIEGVGTIEQRLLIMEVNNLKKAHEITDNIRVRYIGHDVLYFINDYTTILVSLVNPTTYSYTVRRVDYNDLCTIYTIDTSGIFASVVDGKPNVTISVVEHNGYHVTVGVTKP